MDYQDLLIWQRAVDLCTAIYELTRSFPSDESYGLTAQLRRSAISVASNIAEGEGRLTSGERRQALSYARGSLFEMATQLVIASRLGYAQGRTLDADIFELRRKLDSYIAYVRRH